MSDKTNLLNITPEKFIEIMSSYGASMEAIAKAFDVSKRTLERRISDSEALKRALIKGRESACNDVARVAFEMATSGKCAKMTQFWLQTQNGWGSDQTTINEDKVSYKLKYDEIRDKKMEQLSEEDLLQLERILMKIEPVDEEMTIDEELDREIRSSF